MSEETTEQRTAAVSECGRYRYSLSRRWATGTAGVFVGINPSTADAEAEDATTRKWRGFAERFGWGGYTAINAFAFRATDQRKLLTAADPVGLYFESYFAAAVRSRIAPVVCCWGSAKTAAVRALLDGRLPALAQLLIGLDLSCLGRSKDGSPRHPLMLGYDTPLQPWRFA